MCIIFHYFVYIYNVIYIFHIFTKHCIFTIIIQLTCQKYSQSLNIVSIKKCTVSNFLKVKVFKIGGGIMYMYYIRSECYNLGVCVCICVGSGILEYVVCVHCVRRGVISQRAWSLGCEVVREGAGYDLSCLREGEGSWNETWNGAFRVPGGDRRGSSPALCDRRQGQSPVINSNHQHYYSGTSE